MIAGREHTRGASFVIFYRGRVISGTLAAHDDADDVGFFAKGELPVLAFETTKKILELWKNKISNLQSLGIRLKIRDWRCSRGART